MIRWYALRVDGTRHTDSNGVPYTLNWADKQVASFMADLRFGTDTPVMSVVEWEEVDRERKLHNRNLAEAQRRLDVMDRMGHLLDQERTVEGTNRLSLFAAEKDELPTVMWTRGTMYEGDESHVSIAAQFVVAVRGMGER